MHVNLLPSSFVRRVTLLRLARRWGLAAALALVGAGGLLGEKYLALLSTRQRERCTAIGSKDVRLMQGEIDRMTAEAASIAAEITRLREARPVDHTLSLIGVASGSVQELSGKVQLKQLTTQMASAASGTSPATPNVGNRPAAGGAASAGLPNDFILEGVAENAGVIAAFVDVLRGTGMFYRVDLASTSETAGLNGPVRQFRVNCRF